MIFRLRQDFLPALTFYEYRRYFNNQLSDSLINSAIEIPAAELSTQSSRAKRNLFRLIMDLEESSYEQDDVEKKRKINEALSKLSAQIPDLDKLFKAAQSRMKWVNRIDFIGKLALIVAAAALTGGIAGAIVGVN